MVDECSDQVAFKLHEKMAEECVSDIFSTKARENIVRPVARSSSRRRRSHGKRIEKRAVVIIVVKNTGKGV